MTGPVTGVSGELAKMLSGQPYDARAPQLLALAHRARNLCARFNAMPSIETAQRTALLHQLLGVAGEGLWIEAPFFCDYGSNIDIGPQAFVHTGAVLLDSALIRIGRHSLLGPGVHIYTAYHAVKAADRRTPGWTPASSAAPYRTMAKPVVVGEECWIGGGTIIMPGVTIGERATIGAGSVVTHNLPADCVAFGNPARVRSDEATEKLPGLG